MDDSEGKPLEYRFFGKEITPDNLHKAVQSALHRRVFSVSDQHASANSHEIRQLTACEEALSTARILDYVLKHLPSLAPVLRSACVCRRWALAASRPVLRARADLSGPSAPFVRDHEILRLLRRHGVLITDLDFTGCK